MRPELDCFVSPDAPRNAVPDERRRFDIVVIGCSAGGLGALSEVFSTFSPLFPLPIIVAQHRGDCCPHLLPALLALRTKLKVEIAQNLGRLAAGSIYICPAGNHVEILNTRMIRLRKEPRINFVRPCVDLLLGSAAKVFGRRAICVILSGGGADGAMGTRAIFRAGGMVIAQDEQSSDFDGMPTAAADLGKVDLILPLRHIGPAISYLASDHDVCDTGESVQLQK